MKRKPTTADTFAPPLVGLTFLPCSVDVFATMVLLFLVHAGKQPRINECELPAMRPASGGSAGVRRDAEAIHLSADGSVRFRDRQLPAEQAAQYIREHAPGDGPLQLLVQTDESGHGATTALLQLQTDLGRHGLWPRVRVLIRRDEPSR